MMKFNFFVTLFTLTLLAALALQIEALKCYDGKIGQVPREVNCKDSCVTFYEQGKLTGVDCYLTKHPDGECIDKSNSKACFCNMDLCNKLKQEKQDEQKASDIY